MEGEESCCPELDSAVRARGLEVIMVDYMLFKIDQ